ncbi:MAG: hypothetical protein R2879_06650 [Saprospiraceae bacterium]
MKNKNLMVGLLALFCLGFYQLNAQTVTRNTPVYIGKWKWQSSELQTRGMATPESITPAETGKDLILELDTNDMMKLYQDGKVVYEGQYAVNKQGSGAYIFAWDEAEYKGLPAPEVGPIMVEGDKLIINGAYNDGGYNQIYVKVK